LVIAFQPIFFTTGLFLTALALSMIAPGILDYFHDDINWQAFAISSGMTGFSGLLLTFAARPTEKTKMSARDTFLLTTFNWLALSFFAALPFIHSHATNTITDSFFEAISGLTTTGATVIRGLNYTSPGLLLWRALLQWLGGIGIVVMALTVLPMLRIGGMQLFRNEFSDRSEKILPKVSQIASAIFGTYVFFTILCSLALWGAGMTWLEAVCHAMATLSTGGFSTHGASIQHFDSPLIDVILIIFMTIGGTTLILFVRCFQKDFKSLYQDNQVRGFLLAMTTASLCSTLWLWHQNYSFGTALRHSTFQVVSIMTTTGFVSADYTSLGTFPVLILLMMMMIGGCTGSTAGGIKVFRYQVMYATARANIQQLRKPHGVFLSLYNRQQIPEGIFLSVFSFFGLFIICFGLLSLGLSLYDFDIFTCLSAAVSCLNNVGTGFGTLIGHTGDYTALPDGAKWMLMAGMLLGRLEYITVLILLSPKFWRD
jgi:trk system potassium uptake protein